MPDFARRLNFDGSVDRSGRVVKGAVDDFFGGRSIAPYTSPPELQRCPRQVSVTYREAAWNTWMVAKWRSVRSTCTGPFYTLQVPLTQRGVVF